MIDPGYIKIAVIEDNLIVSTLLKKMLSSYTGITFEIVLELTSLNDFDLVSLSSAVKPDVILLDINLPGISGLAGIPILSKHFPDSYIIILTEVEDKDTIMKCLQAGAKGYVTKGLSQKELVDVINSVIEGGSYLSPAITRKVLDHIQNKNTLLDDLTARQKNIVEGIVEGLSYKLIGYKHDISIDTVREHIKNIYKKLNINSKGELIALLKF